MDKNKEPIKTRCPLSESGDLEEAKGEGAEGVGWSTKPHGDELGAGWFSSIGQEKLGTALQRRSLNLVQKKG